MDNCCAVILAAGDGKRMKSAHPKVMCEVLFRPMISWVSDACLAAGIPAGCAVLGEHSDEVKEILPPIFQTVYQTQRRGTGHAAGMARKILSDGGFSHTLIVNGDAPFLSAEGIKNAYNQHISQDNAVTVISAQTSENFGYGRILRDGSFVIGIVEEKDADDAQRKIDEINSGAYWFKTDFLLDFFENMSCDNTQHEYYLTDSVRYAVDNGFSVGAYKVHEHSILGANSRVQLAHLNEIARTRVIKKLLDEGVDIPFSDGIIIGDDVTIGIDTRILPGCIIRGGTTIGTGCEIGPNSVLNGALIGDNCRIISSYIEKSVLKNGVKIGPMTNIRPDCHLADNAKIGDFVELKNSYIGASTAVAHLTYVGDSDVGDRCNFGCGVVTVNYNGVSKSRTVIGNDAFIGCNTNLVAPLKIGDNVYTAAGTTVTDDVPSGALVIGRVRQIIKANWAKYSKNRHE